MKRRRLLLPVFAGTVAAGLGLAAAATAQDISCAEGPAVATSRMIGLERRQLLAWADAPLSGGGLLGDELRAQGMPIEEFGVGTEVVLTLPGEVESSIFMLERESPDAGEHAWVVLYSTAPTVVRRELERQGIAYPWNGFVLTQDGGDDVAPLRLWLLGSPEHQLGYDPARRTFHRLPEALTAGDPAAAISRGCIECLLDLVKSVVCEAIADGVACATVAGCPGAVISALIRASWKLLTGDLCFQVDATACLLTCALPQIKITPASNAQVAQGRQQIKVDISGTNAGAWALPVPQGGRPGAPLIKLGANPRLIEWNPGPGVYTIYAGNVPLLNTPGIARSTNVRVGQPQQLAPVSWRIIDGCSDGRGLRVRFFDKTRGGAFPAQGGHFSVPIGAERTFTFNAPRGSRLCLGAVQDPPRSTWWCYGIDGSKDGSYSPLCCGTVPATGTLSLSNRLICE